MREEERKRRNMKMQMMKTQNEQRKS